MPYVFAPSLFILTIRGTVLAKQFSPPVRLPLPLPDFQMQNLSPLYLRFGYTEVERYDVSGSGGMALACVRMRKRL